MAGKMRKAINFDLDTKKLKEVYCTTNNPLEYLKKARVSVQESIHTKRSSIRIAHYVVAIIAMSVGCERLRDFAQQTWLIRVWHI